MTGNTGKDVKAVRIRIEGRVQGVGFRYSARHEAIRRSLNGWVRNADDGSVEIHCQGAAEAVDSMLSWLKEGPPGARVVDLKIRPVSPDASYTSFSIVY